MSLSSSVPEITIEKDEGKRVWPFPPTFRMEMSSSSSVPEITIEKDEGKHVWPFLPTFRMTPPRLMGYHMINYTFDKTHRDTATCRRRKGLSCDHSNREPIRNHSIDKKRCFSIPGYFVPPFLWPFVEEMTAKSDDKTLVVTHITGEMKQETDFLKLFQPFGEVTMAKLAHADEKGNFNWGFGFVTFLNKEDAQKAMNALNGSGPYGWDKCILKVNWASTVKRFT